MRKILAFGALSLALAAAAGAQSSAPAHIITAVPEIKWGPAPPVFEKGAQMAVLSGTFALGMGEKFDAAALKELGPGGYGLMPANMRHFAMAKTAVVVQVHGTGPFALTYVNPADDPSKRVTPVPAK